MNFITKTFETPKGVVEGVCLDWDTFSLLMVTGSKGFLACPAIDAVKCDTYEKACALVESSADNPIKTLERFCERKITHANEKAKQLGIQEGMLAKDAFELIA